MQQKVKFEAQCARTEVNLADIKDGVFKAVILPEYAEILQVNVEVLEAAEAGRTLSVGLDEEQSFFASNLDIAKKGANHAAAKVTTINGNANLTLKASAACSQGKICVRAFYFLPSEKLIEYPNA